ncbi:hypothetical protein C0J52_02222 [Blattella germanica]|nr:hypothetical protein C0J52_02222 [Blattella germanica]
MSSHVCKRLPRNGALNFMKDNCVERDILSHFEHEALVRSYVYFKSIVGINGTDYTHSRKDFIKLHHGKQHFSIGKDALLLLAVLKTGRGVERRRHEKKHMLESLLRWNNLLSSSTCKRTAELGIPRTTMRDHMKRSEGQILNY